MKLIQRPKSLQQYQDDVKYAADLSIRLMQLQNRNCPEAKVLQLAIMQTIVTLSDVDILQLRKKPGFFCKLNR